MVKRKAPPPPTQRQLDILTTLAQGAVLTRRIAGSRMYQLVAGDWLDLGQSDEGGNVVDALTVPEAVALWKRGWIAEREGWEGGPKAGGQYIITDAGDELVEGAVHG